MASLSNINGIFDVHSTGAVQFNGNHGASGQILKSNGNAAPTWVAASTVIGGPYLPLAGGTLTGATATASGINFTVGGTLTASNFSGSSSGTNTGDQTSVTGASGYLDTNRGTPSNAAQYWQAYNLGTTEAPSLDWYTTLRLGHGNPATYYGNTLAIKMTGSGSGDIYTQNLANGTFQGWKKYWNDSNFNPASYLPLSGGTLTGALTGTSATFSGNVAAATFNGLAINTTGTNNVANQIVRTEANGYVNFGWINTISGASSGTITRIYASQDAYIRYMTPASFRTQITDPYYAPTGTVSGVTSVATGNGLTGGTITSTGTLTMSGTYSGSMQFSGTHGSSQIGCQLPAASNGANTGVVNLRMWCSEPGVTWDWAGFGYNVTNDNGSPSGFGRLNTAFGQAYQRYSTSGDMYFFNTNTAGARVTTLTLNNNGQATFGYTVTAPTFVGALTGNATTASSAAQVTINYNNNSNANYQMLWGSGNNVYGTAGVVVNALSNTITATTFSGSLSGNANTSTMFNTNRTNYKGVTDGSVIGQMMWKNYGNNHTIFDASSGTSPQGNVISNVNSINAWGATYPTLMGWNGSSTYGVRVDSARVADSTTGSAASAGTLTHNAGRTDGTAYPVVWMAGSPSPAYSCSAVTITSSIGRINATTFNGALTGNATSATSSTYIDTNRGAPSSALQYWQASGLGTTEAPSGDWYNTIRMGHGSPTTYYGNTLAIKMTGSGVGDIYTQALSNGTFQGWKKYWNDSNFTPGSYLPLSGGTMTGALICNSTFTTNSTIIANSNAYFNQDIALGFTSGSIGGRLNIRLSAANQIAIKNNLNGVSNPTGLLSYTTASMNSGGYHMVFQAAPTSGSDTNMLLCDLNGNLRNRNNSYGQYSDETIKENITDATPKLEDVKKLKVKNFNFIGDDLKQIGLIAQETEKVFPGLVEDDLNPQGDRIKSLKYSVLVPILVKAIQELEIRVKELENK